MKLHVTTTTNTTTGCWCDCLCYLHFAPENPEDGEMYFLVQAHPSCPKVHRAIKWLCMCTTAPAAAAATATTTATTILQPP